MNGPHLFCEWGRYKTLQFFRDEGKKGRKKEKREGKTKDSHAPNSPHPTPLKPGERKGRK